MMKTGAPHAWYGSSSNLAACVRCCDGCGQRLARKLGHRMDEKFNKTRYTYVVPGLTIAKIHVLMCEF
jgi:positive regulator of sigma E activity